MKQYKVLVDFKGSQTGNSEPDEFTEGTTVALSDHLAETALQWGYAELVEGKAKEGAPSNKAHAGAPENKGAPVDKKAAKAASKAKK